MAVFPSLTPNARSLGLGNYPQLEYTGTSGASVRFLQNTKRVNQTLTLTFNSITETQINLIYAHYEEQQSTLIPFTLPSTVWAGYDAVPIAAVDYEWRYARSFSVSPSTPGHFNVTIELESVII